MIYASFNVALWTILFFVVGMIKPKWPLFFLKEPSRFIVLVISIVLTMIALTMYGEGNRQKQLEEQEKTQPVAEDIAPVVDAVPAVDATPAVAPSASAAVPVADIADAVSASAPIGIPEATKNIEPVPAAASAAEAM